MNASTHNPTGKILAFGTAHEVQGEKFQLAVDDRCYRDSVEELVKVYAVDTIFEEASGYSPSYAEVIADSRSPKVTYVDIDPPRKERAQHGLSAATSESIPIDLWSQPPCSQRLEYVAQHAKRELFWLKRIREYKFVSALFICGVAHSLSFSFRLVDAGYEVERCISYLPYAKLCRHV
jgi:hypothetical protein